MAKGFHDHRYRELIGKLVERRRELGLSQASLAVMLKQHQQFVSRFETGERRLDVIEFFDVVRALEIDVMDIITLLAPSPENSPKPNG